jgi:hypothetical protein
MRPGTLIALAGAVMLSADYGANAGRGSMGGYRLSPEERSKRQAARASRAVSLLAKAEAKRERRRQKRRTVPGQSPGHPEKPSEDRK